MEFASIFHSFGTEVTLLEMLPRIVPLEDEEISAELRKIVPQAAASRSSPRPRWKRCTRTAPASRLPSAIKPAARKRCTAERVLVAVGRAPNTENLGSKDARKWSADSCTSARIMETDEPGVYAIGDIVAGMPQLAHAASMEGIVAVGKMAGKATPAI